jgi:hypothetical protein
MNCTECKIELVSYVEGITEPQQQAAVEQHLKECPDCRAELAELTKIHDRLVGNGQAVAQRSLETPVMDRIVRETTFKLRKFTMWKRYGRAGLGFIATAAALIGFVVVIGTMSSKAAYALEQTIEANRAMRFIHLTFEPRVKGSVKELWAQFDDEGRLLKLRYYMPDTEDGPKDVLWQEDKAEVWFKRKNAVGVFREKNMLATLRMPYAALDPKLLVESLYNHQVNGTVHIETAEPSAEGEPIVLTISVEGIPDRREIYKVDPKTKLLQEREKYVLRDGEYELLGRTRYLDYNKPVDPEVFVLNAPDDAMRVDQTVQEVGLAQGDLTDEEIAIKVVRTFFEALIARDYVLAGQICAGLPAAKMAELFGKLRVVRIVSVGDPKPPSDLRRGGLVVACQIEIEQEGVKVTKDWPAIGVRPVYKQPGRWNIYGGI